MGGNEMTLNQTSDQFPDSAAFAALAAPSWKAFSFETGDFLLHVPSAHVLEVPRSYALHVRGEAPSAEIQAELDELALSLPLPPAREIKADITSVSLNMAQGCNLRCTYCFAGEGDYGKKAMMSAATAVRALELLARGKDRFQVLFFGGEPMLNFAVIEQVVAWCETQTTRFTYSMTTNGTLLTGEKLAWLREKGFAITLSYDGKGLQAKQRLTKDRIHSSEALVERKLEAFKEQLGKLRDFRLRATITKANLALLEEAIVTTLTARNFRTVVAHQATPLRALAFGAADIERLAEIFRSVVDRLLAAGDLERVLKLENIGAAVRMIHQGRTHELACGAGVSYLTVSAEGAFYLCHRFNEDDSERFGDVEHGPDRERLDEVALFRARRAGPCGTCWMREWCAGGCFHEHKSATGDKFRLDPLYCKLQSLELEQAMRVYTIICKQAPQLLEA